MGHSLFYSAPHFKWKLPAQCLCEFSFKVADKILNLSNANFKGAENKILGFWKLPSIAGVQIKNGMSEYMAKQPRHKSHRATQIIPSHKHCSLEMNFLV